MRRVKSLLMSTLILLSMLTLAFNVQPIEAFGTIYIKADGSVDPPTANITSTDNVTYILTDNIYDSIVVERNNIVVDGASYTVEGNESGIGIDLSERSNVTIENLKIKAFDFGIYLNHSLGNSIMGNHITANNFEGIRLYESSNNSIAENNILNNYYGTFLAMSSNNSVVRNNIEANEGGISLDWSSNKNSITKNDITANNWYGIWLNESSSNIIYHNNFVGNVHHVYTNSSVNVWDGGYPSGGNYWSDYNGTDLFSGSYQNMIGSDGLGDTPCAIDENNRDNYPLMGMFYDFEVIWWSETYHVEVVSNSTVSNLWVGWVLDHWPPYLPFGQVFIQFSAEGMVNTTRFCRVTIPRAVLNGTYVVLIDYEEVPAHELPASNSTQAYLYFTYKHTKQKHDVIIVPEFPTILIIPLFMLATLLPVIVYKRELILKS